MGEEHWKGTQEQCLTDVGGAQGAVQRTEGISRVGGQVLNNSDLKFDGHLDPMAPFSQIPEETMKTSQAACLNVKSVRIH